MARNFMLLYGKKSVFERLKMNPASVKKVYMQDRTRIPHIEKLIHTYAIPVERISARRIENMKRAKNLQGIIARVDRFRHTPYEELLSLSEQEKLILVFLDRINDPQNLGVILRSLACFGGYAVIIPEKGACMITEAVLHVACGGENYIRIAKVQDLGDAIISAKSHGYWIMGAMADTGKSIHTVSMKFPLGLILGAEAEGISPKLKQLIDAMVHIPMPGIGLSLNVGMACAVFAYEINRQRAAGA
jgi:23S rRNA (guanosine2251-2'-O)-methyltransferase